ncbi:tyrosine-type recombinase/integrase [Allorhodopirellula heiligendammensis]|uniref:tyrosine-type recombinase/integrase n=1 Tax=Allorhodopirellula heiligendammensis TaxID=2714739 RepID=UPI0011B791B4|nr:hypothetical protein [Allorhodopirellula heiligendammensis]
MFRHATGQWAKKVRGKTHYFGTDKDSAAERWYKEKDALYAGETPKSRNKGPTITELANVFNASQRQRHETTGKPGLRHIELCERTIRRLIGFVGADCNISSLGPDDYAKIKLRLFEPVKRTKPVRGKVFGRQVARRSPETVAGDVRRIKTFLNWCHDSEYIAAPRFGNKFPNETEVAVTKASLKQQSENRKDIAAGDILALINAARVNFKPLIWLAINSGIGNADIAAIEWDDIATIDDNESWIDLPRLKTGAPRRFILWPETKFAIKEYLAIRNYSGERYKHLVFLTSQNLPWVRGKGDKDHVDSIGTVFAKLRDDCGVKGATFYGLRRTFATIGCESLDFAAVKVLMGHVKDKRDMTSRYAQGVGDERIKAVTDHVRQWVLNGAEVAK